MSLSDHTIQSALIRGNDQELARLHRWLTRRELLHGVPLDRAEFFFRSHLATVLVKYYGAL